MGFVFSRLVSDIRSCGKTGESIVSDSEIMIGCQAQAIPCNVPDLNFFPPNSWDSASGAAKSVV